MMLFSRPKHHFWGGAQGRRPRLRCQPPWEELAPVASMIAVSSSLCPRGARLYLAMDSGRFIMMAPRIRPPRALSCRQPVRLRPRLERVRETESLYTRRSCAPGEAGGDTFAVALHVSCCCAPHLLRPRSTFFCLCSTLCCCLRSTSFVCCAAPHYLLFAQHICCCAPPRLLLRTTAFAESALHTICCYAPQFARAERGHWRERRGGERMGFSAFRPTLEGCSAERRGQGEEGDRSRQAAGGAQAGSLP